MSDNTKKYLWIAAAVSAFVLVVAAAALLVFKPTPASERTPFDMGSSAETKQTQTTDYSAQSAGTATPAPTTEGGKSGDVYIVYGDKGQTTTTVVMTGTPGTNPPKSAPTTISVAPVTTTSVKAASTVQPAAPASGTKALQSKPAAPPATAAPAAPATVPASAKPVDKTPSAPGTYWIQTGSFSKQASAAANRDFLAARHFSAEIKNVGGNYKVRIGPYATKAEAVNMLPSVKLLKGFEAAWITQ